MKASLTRVFTLGAGLLLFLSGVLAIAPFTSVGSRIIVNSVSDFLPLEVEYSGGSLMGKIALSRVQYTGDELRLVVFGLSAELDASCLWRSEFCLRQLSAEQAELEWEGGVWRSEQIQARVSMAGSSLIVYSIRAADMFLQLRESTQASADFSTATIRLPMELVVHQAELSQGTWDIHGSSYRYQDISLAGQWKGSELVLDNAEIAREELGVLQLQGRLTLAGDWPFELSTTVNWNSGLPLSNLLAEYFPALQVQDQSAVVTQALLLSPWRVSVSGTLQEQSFSVDAALSAFDYDALRLSLSGVHSFSPRHSGQSQFIFDDVELRDDRTNGVLKATAKLLLGEKNYWRLSASPNQFRLPATVADLAMTVSGTVAASGHYADSSWLATLTEVDLQGDVGGEPVYLSGHIAVSEGGVLAGSVLSAEVNGVSLQATSRLPGAEGIDGQLSVADLGRWMPDAHGSLELVATLDGEFKAAGLTGQVNNFKWQNFAVPQAGVTGEIALADSHKFTLMTKLAGASVNGVDFESINLNAAGNQYEQLLQLGMSGDIAASLHGKSVVTVADAGMVAKLDLEGELSSLRNLLPQAYDGRGKLKLDVDVGWHKESGTRLVADIQVDQPALHLDTGDGQGAKIQWDLANLHIYRDEGSSRISAEGLKQGRKLFTLDLSLPARREESLSGELSLQQLDVNDFAAFVPTLSALQGVVDGQVKLSGTAEHILGHGELTLSRGSFSLQENPTQFESLELSLNLQGDSAEIDGSGLLGGGPLTVTGSLEYQPEPTLALHLSGENETLMLRSGTQIQVSPDLHLMATSNSLDISGQLAVHEGVLVHDQLPEGGVQLSSDVVVVGFTESRPHFYNIGMDVQVAIADRFKVVGKGVDVTVGGDLHLLQERGHPLQLFGNLHVVGGELRAYRQHLQVRRGTVAFSGAPENPALDMRAERVLAKDNVTVGVELSGTLEQPRLQIYSNPVMPQAESLSYLIRGRGLDAGAGADGTALALSTGIGLVNQTGLLTQFDKVPGLSDVALSAEGLDDDTTATVSGYIGDRIYLAYGVGLYEPINVLTARLYLQTRLWIEVVSSLENSLDLYYSFDID